ncbi:MAG: bifunctional MaoC family dehydratase N-terminal/OB-fold nucleic acid binding domain-containing protein [Acidimicrobiales bacterium]
MSLIEMLRAYEGRDVGPPFVGLDPVNRPMIRHWCDAMGDTNPVYTDEEAAAASVHGGIIAPPTMLQTWGMWGYRPRPTTGGSERDALLRLLNEHGFTSVVATNCEQEYVRDLRPDDELTITSTIEAVSDEKRTGLGDGHFVTTKETYRDAAGEVVATMLFRILKFRPPERPAARPLRPRPSLTKDNEWWFVALRDHKLLIQRCTSCGALRHPPRPMCDRCQSVEWDTVEASGRGTIYSFVINHYPQVPAFDYPLPVALVELEEGTRLVANVAGIEPGDLEIGTAVEVEFVDHDPELTLPAFHPPVHQAGG